ncbi:MAG: tripartite tricarboxylate transporter substrate-binding protein [Deltaproteobacteria bacterium]|nr:tripartite tricarboxylate transporter substrate-binding protein [Deltaproteobacteria bacterium]
MLRRIVLLTALLALTLVQTPAGAEEFYKGKTLRMLVGFSPGGGYDTYTRYIARYIGKYIPGNPTPVVQNMPGAGSLITATYVFKRAKPDGRTLGVWSPALIFAHAMGDKKVKIDPAKYEYIGTPTSDSVTCGLMAGSGLKSLDDVVKSGRTVAMGGTRAPGNTTDPFLFLNKQLGTKFKSIPGYGGTAKIRLAMESGEGDGACWTWESMRVTARGMLDASGDKKFVPFVITKRHADPEVKDIPLFSDVLTGQNLAAFNAWNAQNQITRVYTLPPGTPGDRVATLRKAYKAVMEDPGFLAEAKKSRLNIAYVSPRDIADKLKSINNMPPDIKEYLQVLTGFKKPQS